MQAMIIDRFGGPDVLHLSERPKPEPNPGEVLIRTHCAGVNYIDALTRTGSGVAVEHFPAILGWDLSGTVVALGAGVTRFREGDAVFGMPRFPALAEAYAEYVAAPAHELAHKPASVDDETAASVPMTALTAWLALFTLGNLRAGQRVFVHGASGGVGHVAVQLARDADAEVIGAASAAHHNFVVSLGASQVVDYAEGAIERAARDVDLALDHRGGDDFVRLVGVVRPGGAIVTLKGSHAAGEEAAAAKGVRVERVFVQPNAEVLEHIAARLASGSCRWPSNAPSRLPTPLERTPSLIARAVAGASCSTSLVPQGGPKENVPESFGTCSSSRQVVCPVSTAALPWRGRFNGFASTRPSTLGDFSRVIRGLGPLDS
jgi:NADPH:quinone reductase-like Zn-dependent oxidoreductase